MATLIRLIQPIHFLALLVLPTCVYSMSGMGFNNLDNWPTSGVNNVRIWDIGASWREIHLGVDNYDWSRLDAIVDQIQSIGAGATYVIGATPQWLAKYPDQEYYAAWLGPGSNSMPYDIDEFNKFCWNLATRYAGRIQAYEVWNEPQLADFLYPYDDTELDTLANMTNRAYNTMKSCDGGAQIMAASILPRESSGGMSRASKYLTNMQNHGWNVDGFTCHIYPNIDEGADSWNAMLVDTINTIASFGPPTTQLWVTETNYNLLGSVIPEESAADLVEATFQYAAAAGLTNVYWYGWDTTANLGGLNINHDTTAWAQISAHA